MNYYTTLGVTPNASQAEIKTAFRKKAMQHHPDRGGNEVEFKKINEAYDVLSDPQKKHNLDSGIDPNGHRAYGNSQNRNQSPFEFSFSEESIPPDMFNMFNMFGRSSSRAPRNQPLSVAVAIELVDVITGKDVNAEIGSRAGKSTPINIKIPPGIESGQQIRYQGMGDTSVTNAPPGDLIVTVMVRPNAEFQRDGDNLVTTRTISVWDAILGGSIIINTLLGKSVEITIPKGTQPNQLLRCKQEGLPNIRSLIKGDLYVKIMVSVPVNLSDDRIVLVKELAASIN